MAKILLISQHILTKRIKLHLNNANYAVDIIHYIPIRYQISTLIKEKYDCLIFILSEPLNESEATLNLLRFTKPELNIIVYATFDDFLYKIRCLENGVDCYIDTEFVPDELLSCLVALFRRNDMNNHFFMLRYKQYKLDLVKRKFVTPHNVINLSKKEFLVLELLFRYTYSDKEEIKNHLNSNALGYVRSINYIMTTLNKIFYVNSDLLIKYIHGKYYLCTRAT